MNGQGQELVARFQRVKTDRATFEQRWETIRQLQRPDAAPFFGEEARGDRESGRVLDNTAEDAADMAAAGLGGMLTGQAVDWHGWEFDDDELREHHGAKAWLAGAARKQQACYRNPKSRFGQAMDAVYLDLIDFSNSCLYIEDRRGQLPLFLARPIQQVYWLANAENVIDTVFWNFKLSARNAVGKFGQGAVPEKIARAAENPRKTEDQFEFLHAVMPSGEAYDRRRVLGPKPFKSCWVSVDDKHVMREGGYFSLPYIPFRWRVRAGERYGRGPSDKALADVAVLQQMDRLVLEGLEMTIRPSLMLPDDGVIGPVGLRTADLTYVRPEYFFRGGDPIRPIQSGAQPQLGEEAAEARRQRIRKAFLSELLQILRDPRATATQVLEVREEQFRLAAPIVNALEAESLGPLADRTFELMARGGFFGEVPDELAEADVNPTFLSPMARAQALSEVRGFSQWLDMAMPLAQNGIEDVMDVMDVPKGMRRTGEILGVPYDVMRSPEQAAEVGKARGEQAQRAAELEAEKDRTTAAKNEAAAAKDLAQAGAGQGPGAPVPLQIAA